MIRPDQHAGTLGAAHVRAERRIVVGDTLGCFLPGENLARAIHLRPVDGAVVVRDVDAVGARVAEEDAALKRFSKHD